MFNISDCWGGLNQNRGRHEKCFFRPFLNSSSVFCRSLTPLDGLCLPSLRNWRREKIKMSTNSEPVVQVSLQTFSRRWTVLKYLPVIFWFRSVNGFRINFILKNISLRLSFSSLFLLISIFFVNEIRLRKLIQIHLSRVRELTRALVQRKLNSFLRDSRCKVNWSGEGRQGVFGSLFSSLLQPFDWLGRKFLSSPSSSFLHPYPSFIHSF